MLKKVETNFLSICVPVYNEEKSIKKTISDLYNSFQESEIIVVNDGSNDKTYELLKSIEKDNVILLNNHKNMGYGYSLKKAMEKAKGKYIAWFDGDGQHRIEDLKNIYNYIINEGCDVVIGARGEGSYQVKKRIIGKLVLKIVAQFIVKERIPDLNSGLRVFKKDAILRYMHLLPNGFSASSTSTVIMHKFGYDVRYVKIKTKKRKGKSTVNIFIDGFRSLKLLFNLFILFEAFNFFLFLSAVQLFVGFIYGFYMAWKNKLGFPIFASTLVITGVFTFFFGILAEQITAMRKEK